MNIENIERMLTRKRDVIIVLSYIEGLTDAISNILKGKKLEDAIKLIFGDIICTIDRHFVLCNNVLFVLHMTQDVLGIYKGLNTLLTLDPENIDDITKVQEELLMCGFSDFRPEIYESELKSIEQHLRVLEGTLGAKLSEFDSLINVVDKKENCV